MINDNIVNVELVKTIKCWQFNLKTMTKIWRNVYNKVHIMALNKGCKG
jgi:hypothetical protein